MLISNLNVSARFLTSVQEEMAAASLDVNFKEELSAIEQCTYPNT